MPIRILLACVAPIVLAVATPDEKPKETEFKPTAVFRGSHSNIRKEKFDVIATASEWEKMWELHRGKLKDRRFTETSQKLSIDFDTHYVVAIFTGWDSSLFVTTFSKGDSVLIRFTAHGYQTEGRPPGGDEDKRTDHEKAKERAVADYCFVVLPKPVKAIIIEEDVRRDLTESPVWKERARFPASKDKK